MEIRFSDCNSILKRCSGGSPMFNPTKPTVIHIDLNSCFATIEQQANPRLRGKPVVVAAYTTPNGCILAASTEAKQFGVKTGMRVADGRLLCPHLVVLPSDPDKYRFVNRKLLTLLEEYSSEVEVRSIDEMVLRLTGSDPVTVAQELKLRIKQEIGEWLTVSIGISTNRYLAKIASGLHKPDGLDVIDKNNIEEILTGLALEDLCGIKAGYGGRLRRYSIQTPLMMYYASSRDLQCAFASKTGCDWWLWLHGYESDLFDRNETKSIGHSYALKIPYTPVDSKLHQILCQLVEKMGRRLREHGFLAQGIHISCVFTDHTYWNHGEKLSRQLFTSRNLYEEALRVLQKAPHQPIRILAVSCFSLAKEEQLSFWSNHHEVTKALDTIADRWGEFTVFPARMLSMEQKVLDRIAFGAAR